MRYFRLVKFDGVVVDTITIMDTNSPFYKRKLKSLKRDGMEYKEISKEEFDKLQEAMDSSTIPKQTIFEGEE